MCERESVCGGYGCGVSTCVHVLACNLHYFTVTCVPLTTLTELSC